MVFSFASSSLPVYLLVVLAGFGDNNASSVFAFHQSQYPQQLSSQQQPRHFVKHSTSTSSITIRQQKNNYYTSSSSLQDKWNDGFDNLDDDGDSTVDLLEKAQDIAKHFGEYSYEEIEHVRDDLQDHRIKQTMTTRRSNDYMSYLESSKNDEPILEKFLEDDLSLQLQMLKGELSDSSKNQLFPDYDNDSTSTNDDNTSTVVSAAAVAPAASPKTVVSAAASVETTKQPQNFESLFLLENGKKAELIQGVTESALICALLGVFMMIDMLFTDGYFNA